MIMQIPYYHIDASHQSIQRQSCCCMPAGQMARWQNHALHCSWEQSFRNSLPCIASDSRYYLSGSLLLLRLICAACNTRKRVCDLLIHKQFASISWFETASGKLTVVNQMSAHYKLPCTKACGIRISGLAVWSARSRAIEVLRSRDLCCFWWWDGDQKYEAWFSKAAAD